MKIGLFGGSFDPIHNGHLAVARAARRRFGLDVVYFIPCGRPPHKDRPGLSPFLHRYTMVALACAGEPRFLPSLLEAGPDLRGTRRSYSIDTVRRLRRLFGSCARLYFLLGGDAFLYLPQWKNFSQLIRLCDFIVADRPGFNWRGAARSFVAAVRAGQRDGKGDALRLSHSTVHFLRGVRVPISATEIRRAARRGRSLTGLVPSPVREYIERLALYQGRR
ncbi:MAG: nicotinate (nicotinamide) nucleotide adenylyltransferase [Acidobacteria bacterium]|nr:nicotinate (nicotinamide) nucleotide adenylyltransferase [Acidobacteriota bacterium]